MLAPLLMMKGIHEHFPELVLPRNEETDALFEEFEKLQVMHPSNGLTKLKARCRQPCIAIGYPCSAINQVPLLVSHASQACICVGQSRIDALFSITVSLGVDVSRGTQLSMAAKLRDVVAAVTFVEIP